MTNQENKIPIKGYATFHPLKHCLIGSGFQAEWFHDLPIYKNKKIMDPLKRIAEETEEDYQMLVKLLQDAGVKTYRPELNMEKLQSLQNIYRPPMMPRDSFAVLGEKFYSSTADGRKGYTDIIKRIDKKNLYLQNIDGVIAGANIMRVGKDIFWDHHEGDKSNGLVDGYPKMYKEILDDLEQQGFRVHHTYRGYHSDAVMCIVKPGCIVSLHDIQNYKETFPGWDVLYIPDQSWNSVSDFGKIRKKVGGRWWLKGEEHNDQLIEFVNTWLNDWVGYVEETVFDVNMLQLDENTIICNNYNKEIFDFFKKHKVEPIIFNFRHRFFWDGGIHCITQDLYREGTMEDYFG